MKTPLIFKLLLLLALGLRLIKASKKKVNLTKTKNLNLFKYQIEDSSDFENHHWNGDLTLSLKKYFREQIRKKDIEDHLIFYDLPIYKRHIMLAYHLEIAFRKKSLYHFIWHHPYCLMAIYQQFTNLSLQDYAMAIETILLELNPSFDKNKPIEEQEDLEFIIDGSKNYESIDALNKLFDFDYYLKTLITFLINDFKA